MKIGENINFLTAALLIILSIELFSQDFTNYQTSNSGLPSNNILCLETDNSGSMWIGTDEGLVEYNQGNWKLYSINTYQGLIDNTINDIKLDDTQSLLWLATKKGVSILDLSDKNNPVFIDPYNINNSGLLDTSINRLIKDTGNVMWFGCYKGMSALYDNSWTNFTVENFWLENNKVVSLASGPDSMVYIGTEGGGVSRIKIQSVDAITSASPLTTVWTGFYEPDSGQLSSDNVYSIHIDDNGHQWFGTDDGVAFHETYNTLKDWKNYRKVDGLVGNHVQSICRENENIIWFGTTEGLSRFSGQNWRSFTESDGLINNTVNDLAITKEGSLWIATANGISILNTATSITQKKIKNKDYILLQNFPNPFNPTTNIQFNLTHDSNALLEIYNVSGKLIMELENKFLKAGIYNYQWHGNNAAGSQLSSGIYLVKLTSGNNIIVHKMLLLK